MTKTRRKLQMRMKRAFRNSVTTRKRHQRAISSYKKLVKQFRAA